MKIISDIMLKGGVGKTTASVNKAVGLSNKGYKVLLIDLDPQQSSTEYFFDDEELDNLEFSIYDIFEKMDKETVEKSVYNIRENLDVIPSVLELALLEYMLMNNKSFPNERYLKKTIYLLDKEYDYIIIDCPPDLGLYVVNALFVSDLVEIPFKNDRAGISGYKNTVKFIDEIRTNYEREINIKVLFTMANRNKVDKEMKEEFGELSYNTVIRYQAKPVTENSLARTFIIEGNDSVSLDYKNYIDELEVYMNEQ